jgi:hypothetical protein
MAYDLEYSNYRRPPASCSSFCLGPTAPLAGYYYNDTTTASQYLGVVAPSKVILGVPYYGRKACVSTPTPNQYPVSSVVADSYLDAIGESGASEVRPGSFGTHRDANDPAGQERWDTWVNTTLNCTRELYWDDVASLGLKYDLVNNDKLRGVGLWNLNYGGGSPELWNELRAKFASPWTSLGGGLASAPEVSSWSGTRLDAFIAGTDHALWHRWWTGTAWQPWETLGGGVTSAPGAISSAANHIDVFIRGTDNALWHRTWNGSAWSAWSSLGGVLTSGPDVASWSANRLDVFVRGTDNGLWHLWWDGAAWRGWERLGGVLGSDPAVVSWSSGRVDVFVRGTDSALWHKWWDGVAWRGWESLGGFLTSGAGVSSCASGTLSVFALGRDRSLWRMSFNGSSWSGWTIVGGQWTSDPAVICRSGATAIDLFERGTDNALWQSSAPKT